MRVGLCLEKVGNLHVVRMKQHAVYDKAAQKPSDEDNDPGDDELLVHGLSPFGCAT